MEDRGTFLTQLDQDPIFRENKGSRPLHYPTPEMYAHRLFFIQRNQNTNAVVYEAQFLSGGLLNLNEPITIHWIEFDTVSKTEKIQELNHIQKKLAYGYTFDVISPDLIKFKFVSYEDLLMYLTVDKKGNYKVVTNIAGEAANLQSIYIYAEDLGVFPQVRFAELFGTSVKNGLDVYEKIILNN